MTLAGYGKHYVVAAKVPMIDQGCCRDVLVQAQGRSLALPKAETSLHKRHTSASQQTGYVWD